MFYLGYPSLEELLDQVRRMAGPCETLYALSASTSAPLVGLGLTRSNAAILVSWREGDNLHYCRVPLGSVDYMDRQPLNDDDGSRRAAFDRAWEIVSEYLAQSGYRIVHALPAIPKDLPLLDGHAGFLTYDKAAKTYVRKDAPEVVQDLGAGWQIERRPADGLCG